MLARGILSSSPTGKGRCRPGAEVLQHVPGGIASEHYVAEIHKGGDGKSLGNKRASVCGFCRNLFLPRERAQVNCRRGYPVVNARCLEHPSTGRKVGQGLFAKLLGSHKEADLGLCQKCRDIAELLSLSAGSGGLASFHS